MRSLVHASTAGGVAGEGTGGSGGGGEAGAGGATRRRLARDARWGSAMGDVFDYWTSDPRLVPYFRRIHAKIDPLWADAFPRSALLELKQGTVILDFTVLRRRPRRGVVAAAPTERHRRVRSQLRRGHPPRGAVSAHPASARRERAAHPRAVRGDQPDRQVIGEESR